MRWCNNVFRLWWLDAGDEVGPEGFGLGPGDVAAEDVHEIGLVVPFGLIFADSEITGFDFVRAELFGEPESVISRPFRASAQGRCRR